MTRVALINPGRNQEFADNEPLSLGYLAAFLEANGVEARIIDELADEDVARSLAEFKPGLVGVTATTPLAPAAYAALETARKMGFATVMGGVHASVLPEEAAAHADHVIIGEGEEALLRIVRERPAERIIKGTCVRNIDELPPPARGRINMEFYVGKRNRMPTAHLYFLPKGKRLASMLTSRGCPYNCIFCHNSWKGLPVRYHGADRVVAEVKELVSTYGVQAIFFMDDDFFVNRNRLAAVCEGFRREKLDIIWSANARVTSVTPETLALAKSAGLRQISFGIESGSQRILDILNKKTTVEQGEKAIRMAKEAGVLVYATFMIGNPDEKREDIELTRRFIQGNPIDSLGIGITTPYPGTRLWDRCVEKGLVPASVNWGDFTMESCPVPANEHLSRAEIEQIRGKVLIGSLMKHKTRLIGYYLSSAFLHPKETLWKLAGVLLPVVRRAVKRTEGHS